MNIRAYADSDLSHLIDLTIATFGPFYEAGFRPLVGEAVFEHQNGRIEILAVAASHRGRGIGTALCEHAFSDLRERGVEVVVIGTGGDDFHAPARGLYASLGCTPYPVTVYYRRL